MGKNNTYMDTDFRENCLLTENDVMDAADQLIDYWDTQKEKYGEKYCFHAKRLTEDFKDIVKRHDLFTAPEGMWSFAIEVRGGGIYLLLENYEIHKAHAGNKLIQERREWYELLSAKARLLTAEEYAQMNELEHVAAVTRIRRGKIRSAVKVGKQWRIPELAEPIERGYKPAEYDWIGKLSGIPKQYKIMEDYSHAYFFQDMEDRTKYHVRFTGENIDPLEFTCDRRQRGRIEQVLIAHPDIRCLSDVIVRVDRKANLTTNCRE